MKKNTLYYFSGNSLKFVEARWMRTKLAIRTIVIAVVLGGLVFEVNQMTGDVLGLGIGRGRYLSAENRQLRNQLSVLSTRLAGLESELSSLNNRDNELRLMVDLNQIDDDVRQVGVGGSEERAEYGVSQEMNALLSDLYEKMGRAERELQLQSRSYQDVVERYETNKVRFSHLPAIKPMQGYYDVNSFGIRMHPVLRIMKPHEGLDISNDVGTPVYATGDGVVRFAGRTGGGYGIAVEIDHGYGYKSFYAHLSKVHVREGARVKRGDLIGKSGRTGLVSGPHLHYEVRLNGVRQNPLDYFFDDVSVQEYTAQIARLD